MGFGVIKVKHTKQYYCLVNVKIEAVTKKIAPPIVNTIDAKILTDVTLSGFCMQKTKLPPPKNAKITPTIQ